MWVDIQIFNSFRSSDLAHGSTKLITDAKRDALSPSTCAGGRRVYPTQGKAPGKPSSPEPFLPQENTCAFSLELQNAENRQSCLADVLSKHRGPQVCSTDLRRGLSSNYPLPSGLPTACQQYMSWPGGGLPRPAVSADGGGSCRCGMIRRQWGIIHNRPCPHRSDLFCGTVFT